MTEFNPDLKAYLLAEARAAGIPLNLDKPTTGMVQNFGKELFKLSGCRDDMEAELMLASLKTWKELETSQQAAPTPTIERMVIDDIPVPLPEVNRLVDEYHRRMVKNRLADVDTFLTTSTKESKFVFFCGPSGCGKTTTALALAKAHPETYFYFPLVCDGQHIYSGYQSFATELRGYLHPQLPRGNAREDLSVEQLLVVPSAAATLVALQCGVVSGPTSPVLTPSEVAKRNTGQTKVLLVDEVDDIQLTRLLRNLLIACGFKVVLFGTNAKVNHFSDLQASRQEGNMSDQWCWCTVYVDWPPAPALSLRLKNSSRAITDAQSQPLCPELRDLFAAEMKTTWPLVAHDINCFLVYSPEELKQLKVDQTITPLDFSKSPVQILDIMAVQTGARMTFRKKLNSGKDWGQAQVNLFLDKPTTEESATWVHSHYAELKHGKESFLRLVVGNDGLMLGDEKFEPKAKLPAVDMSPFFHLSMMRPPKDLVSHVRKQQGQAAVNYHPFRGKSVESIYRALTSTTIIDDANANASANDGNQLEGQLSVVFVQALRPGLEGGTSVQDFLARSLADFRPHYAEPRIEFSEAIPSVLQTTRLPCCPAANREWPEHMFKVPGACLGRMTRGANKDKCDFTFHDQAGAVIMMGESKDYSKSNKFDLIHVREALKRSTCPVYVLFARNMCNIGSRTSGNWHDFINQEFFPDSDRSRLDNTSCLICKRRDDSCVISPLLPDQPKNPSHVVLIAELAPWQTD